MKRALALTVAAMLSAAIAMAGPVPKPPKAPESTVSTPNAKPYQIGTASWYGKQFNGRSTASGEPYDMFQFTAAHRTLPLGTLVRVTNLRNGETVIVRINDRGPVPKNRIIDLSYGAAQMLGLRARGIQKVRLDIVTPDEATVQATLNRPE
jgi:peptidoglycan lytic transglycosylase